MRRFHCLTRSARGTMGIWLLSMLFVFYAGCAVRLIAEYDENIDSGITELQRKTERFLTQLQTDLIRTSLLKDGSAEKEAVMERVAYAANADFYLDFLVDLRVLQVRADSYVGNELTVRQLDALAEILDAQKILHESGIASADDIEDMRSAFTRGFKAILKLEIAKKRGQT